MICAAIIWRFLGLFTLIFTVMMMPGLRLAEGYLAAFRTVGAWGFSREDGKREVIFQKFPDTTRPTFIRIEIANRQWLKPDGSGPVRHLDFNGRGLAWMPTALVIALILASPLPWKRRLVALGWGVFFVQIVVFGLLAFAIWNESAEIGLVTVTPFWKSLALLWQSHFITQAVLAAPLLVWIVVTFRRCDLLGGVKKEQLARVNRNSKRITTQ